MYITIKFSFHQSATRSNIIIDLTMHNDFIQVYTEHACNLNTGNITTLIESQNWHKFIKYCVISLLYLLIDNKFLLTFWESR